MNETIVKTSSIKIEVGLNANNLPLQMRWTAEDGNVDKAPSAVVEKYFTSMPAGFRNAPVAFNSDSSAGETAR